MSGILFDMSDIVKGDLLPRAAAGRGGAWPVVAGRGRSWPVVALGNCKIRALAVYDHGLTGVSEFGFWG